MFSSKSFSISGTNLIRSSVAKMCLVGVTIIKLFFFVTGVAAKQDSVFDPLKH